MAAISMTGSIEFGALHADGSFDRRGFAGLEVELLLAKV
jgi:hypothetical protein